MNQRLTASGASKYWIEKSIDALKQAGFEEIKSDDIFNKITAIGNGNPFNASFLEGTPENKTIIEITGDQNLIDIFKSAISDICKGRPVSKKIAGYKNSSTISRNDPIQSAASNQDADVYKQPVLNKTDSYFDGGLLQLIGWTIIGALITVCTLGICFPWALCMIQKWEAKHTVINGHRLYFDGTAMQLFGNWIKWLILTVITIGIYGFWLGIKVRKWTTKHTHFAN